MDSKEELNSFLVKSFNYLLQSEEKAMEHISHKKVSLKEIHLIEQIGKSVETNENTAGFIAKSLGITLGTLTVATNTLILKGLVKRVKKDSDKRIVRLILTKEGENIYNKHANYHNELTTSVINNLSENELKILSNALKIIEKFFNC